MGNRTGGGGGHSRLEELHMPRPSSGRGVMPPRVLGVELCPLKNVLES